MERERDPKTSSRSPHDEETRAEEGALPATREPRPWRCDGEALDLGQP